MKLWFKILLILILAAGNTLLVWMLMGLVWIAHHYEFSPLMVIGTGCVMTLLELLLALDIKDNNNL